MAIQARFKLFKSHTESWETMSQKVADFLTTLGLGKVIGVSHSQESQFGVIAVWYWDVDDVAQPGESV
jgi:DNA phosphorothioation-dependent restriction protein DptG